MNDASPFVGVFCPCSPSSAHQLSSIFSYQADTALTCQSPTPLPSSTPLPSPTRLRRQRLWLRHPLQSDWNTSTSPAWLRCVHSHLVAPRYSLRSELLSRATRCHAFSLLSAASASKASVAPFNWSCPFSCFPQTILPVRLPLPVLPEGRRWLQHSRDGCRLGKGHLSHGPGASSPGQRPPICPSTISFPVNA